MTVPAGDNYCPSCQEVCHDHPSVCTVCGDTLASAPAATSTEERRLPFQDRAFINDIYQRSNEIRAALQNVQEQIMVTHEAQRDLAGALAGFRETLGAHPHADAVMWDPAAAESRLRPTAAQVLEEIPRLVLTENSSLFQEATVTLTRAQGSVQEASSPTSVTNGAAAKTVFDAMTGELGPSIATCDIKEAVLVEAQPRTGLGGILTQGTIEQVRQSERQRHRVVMYMERGAGVTFVQKGILAQKAGAHAVIVGNNTATPWPYIMKDSKGEAAAIGLTIPVIMVKQQDAKIIKRWIEDDHNNSTAMGCNCSVKVSPQDSKDCVICTEAYQRGDTVMRLPGCGHVFHEKCALQWLKRHNTCPYCRRELPTDDEEYEAERRRQQRTHAGSTGQASANADDFYG